MGESGKEEKNGEMRRDEVGEGREEEMMEGPCRYVQLFINMWN